MSSIHLFQYDIPEVRVVSPRTGRVYSRPVIANPSDRLWRAGAVRLTLSCWLIHEGNIPYSIIKRFTDNNVHYETAPFDPSAGANLARMAMASIRKELQEYLTRARETRQAEEDRLTDVTSNGSIKPGSPESIAAHKRYRTQLAAITRRVRKAIDRVSIAAQRFKISPQLINIPDSLASINAIKEGMNRRADTFAEAYNIVVKARGKKDAIATAIASDMLPGPIAADALDDLDTPQARAAAGRLRSAFGW